MVVASTSRSIIYPLSVLTMIFMRKFEKNYKIVDSKTIYNLKLINKD